MTNFDILRNMKSRCAEGSQLGAIAQALLDTHGHFCRITMKPQESDAKRDGKQRVFICSVAHQWLNYEKKHGLGNGRLTTQGAKGNETKSANFILNIVESARGQRGRFVLQPRSLSLAKISSVRCGDKVTAFAD